MNALLISALFATLAGSNELAAQTDTIDRYIINGQVITAFDGSQLVSKTIVNYVINYKTTSDAVIKEHKITTQNPDHFTDVFFNSSAENLPEGAKVTSTTFEGGRITSTTIKSSSPQINIEDLAGALTGDEKPLLVVDDEISTGSIEDINPDDVKSMTVLRGKAAETVWGEKGKNGVIEIKTKKQK